MMWFVNRTSTDRLGYLAWCEHELTRHNLGPSNLSIFQKESDGDIEDWLRVALQTEEKVGVNRINFSLFFLKF